MLGWKAEVLMDWRATAGTNQDPLWRKPVASLAFTHAIGGQSTGRQNERWGGGGSRLVPTVQYIETAAFQSSTPY